MIDDYSMSLMMIDTMLVHDKKLLYGLMNDIPSAIYVSSSREYVSCSSARSGTIPVGTT
jgi:hypothetical protein